MEFIDLKAQYRFLKDRIDARIEKVLEHGQYINGPEVKELEQKLSEFVDVKHTITCANGTDALSLLLKALKIGPGHAVFCPTFTFFATAEVISNAGATPIFIDSDLDTFNMCPKDLKQKIQNTYHLKDLMPKAVISVDLFGLPADYVNIEKIVNEHNLLLIEDAAQGFGGEINNRKAGSFGIAATTSFFPAKPLGCYGDGGAIFTNNERLAHLLTSLRAHGQGNSKYDNVRIGFNSRLDTIQAAILLEKLNVFPVELASRQVAAKKYKEKYPQYIAPKVPVGFKSSWAQYTLRTQNRDKAIKEFQSSGIPTNIYYPKCLHDQEAFRDIRHLQYNLDRSEELAKTVFSLPMHGYLS